MQGMLSTNPPGLEAFLAANMGTPLDDDVGAWLGQAAQLVEFPQDTLDLPSGWREAMNVALATPSAPSLRGSSQ